MTADEILASIDSSTAAAEAWTHLVEGAKLGDKLMMAWAAESLFEAVLAPSCEEAEERVEDLELALAQTVEELDRLTNNTALSVAEMRLSAEHARKFVERVRELWRKR